MCKYENVTNQKKIGKQIDQLEGDEAARAVMQAIDAICAAENIEPDRMTQWLRLLNDRAIMASKLKGSLPYIEIYPSGTHGIGRQDRLILRIGETEVEVMEAGKGSH